MRWSLLRCETCSITGTGQTQRVQLAPQESRQEATQTVRFERDRRQIHLLREPSDLATELARLVDLANQPRLVREIADVLQPVRAVAIDEHRCHHACIAGTGRAERWIPPAGRGDHPSPADREDGLAIAFAILERGVVLYQVSGDIIN
jgi:hypothetical protein